MKNSEIIRIIKEIRKGDMSNFQTLYNAFARLIDRYGRRIGEDGSAEITLFFMELIYSLDIRKFAPDKSDGLNRYIAVSLRNCYISLSQRAEKAVKYSDELLEENLKYTFEPDETLALGDGLSELTDRQRTVITYRYFYGFTDSEISTLLCISRQAVHRLETRAIDALREYYCI